ncbi:MAG: hypothetical protein EOM05_11410 [Clostridia bacterium]|nr:hypothetical protein [Clostridia bacterium]
MKRSRFIQNEVGVVNGFLILGLLLLAIALPVAVSLTQKNQESRSNAATETTNTILGACGASTGEYFSTKPTTGLCDGGTLVWNDESADDGDWNWTCKGDESIADSTTECLAVRQ